MNNTILVVANNKRQYFEFKRKNMGYCRLISSVNQLSDEDSKSEYVLLEDWFKKKSSSSIISKLISLDCTEKKSLLRHISML